MKFIFVNQKKIKNFYNAAKHVKVKFCYAAQIFVKYMMIICCHS